MSITLPKICPECNYTLSKFNGDLYCNQSIDHFDSCTSNFANRKNEVDIVRVFEIKNQKYWLGYYNLDSHYRLQNQKMLNSITFSGDVLPLDKFLNLPSKQLIPYIEKILLLK